MKKKYLIFALFLMSSLLCSNKLYSTGGASTLDNLYIECENWESELNCVVSTKSYKTNNGFSNDTAVQFMSGGTEYVMTYVINGVPKAGTYNLNFLMGQMSTRAMFVGINQQNYQKMYFVAESDISLMGLTKEDFGKKNQWGWMYQVSADWYSPVKYSLPVYLEKGTNTVTLTAARHPWYDQWFSGYVDYFTVSDDATVSLEKPENQSPTSVRYDMNEATGSFNAVSGNGLSSGNGIQLQKGQIATLSVNMPEGGVFYLDLFYCSDANRGLKITNSSDNNAEYSFVSENNRTNTGEETVEFKTDTAGVETAINHYGMRAKRFEVNLKSGINNLIFTPVDNGSETSSPVLDMVCINNDRALIKPATYNLLMSNTTKLSCDKGSKDLGNIADNDESTSLVIEGVTSADIIAELNYPHILMGYRIITSLENASKLKTMTVMGYDPNKSDWVSIPVSTNSMYTYQQLAEYNVRTNYGINSGYGNSVSYSKYKIMVTGEKDINISEIQLFGMPLKNGANDVRITGNLLQDSTDDLSTARLSGDMTDALGSGYYGGAVHRMPNRYSVSEDTELSCYLEYDLISPSVIGSYLVGIPYNRFNYSKACYAYTTTSPKDFTLKGLNSNGEWVVLHKISNVTWPFMGTAYTFNTDDSTTVCSKIRLEVTDNCGGYRTEIASWQAFPGKLGTSSYSNITTIPHNVNSLKNIYTTSGRIHLQGFTGNYKVVNLMGQVVGSGSTQIQTSVSVPAGMYIVVTGEGSCKVVVR